MRTHRNRFLLGFLGCMVFLCLALIISMLGLSPRTVHAQQPTGSIPTVTGTPRGPYVTVFTDQNQITVFSGPDSDAYSRIGILVSGESVPAIGTTSDSNWIQIIYLGAPGGKGWIYGRFVSLNGGEVPVVESPPTITPRTTPTIDPTYAAAFGLQLEASQLPTFTIPGAVSLPTFTASSGAGSKVPYGLIIVGLVLVGVLGAVVSFVRGSR